MNDRLHATGCVEALAGFLHARVPLVSGLAARALGRSAWNGPGEAAIVGTLARRAWIELVERVGWEEVREKASGIQAAAWEALQKGEDPVDILGSDPAAKAQRVDFAQSKTQGFIVKAASPSPSSTPTSSSSSPSGSLRRMKAEPSEAAVAAAQLQRDRPTLMGDLLDRGKKRVDMEIEGVRFVSSNVSS